MALLTECKGLCSSLIYKHGTPTGVGPLVLWSTSQINLAGALLRCVISALSASLLAPFLSTRL